MSIARSVLPILVLGLAVAGCSDKIDPWDGEVQQPIPVGVSVQPQRSVAQTGGLSLSGEDSIVPTADVPGYMDTTNAGPTPPSPVQTDSPQAAPPR